jgi:hypothetical protein
MRGRKYILFYPLTPSLYPQGHKSLREREYSVGYQGNAVRKRIYDKQ